MSQTSRVLVRSVGLWIAMLSPLGASTPAKAQDSADDDGSFNMTTPIVCKDIRGYDDYEVLPRAELTSDDKLLVYFRPKHFKTSPAGKEYEAHFTQEGKIRRRGEKPVVWQKAKLLDYTAKSENREMPIFLKNAISLKTLKPGDYQLEITLRDEIGKSPPALKTVFFKIVPPKAEPETKKPGASGAPSTSTPSRRPQNPSNIPDIDAQTSFSDPIAGSSVGVWSGGTSGSRRILPSLTSATSKSALLIVTQLPGCRGFALDFALKVASFRGSP